MNVDHFTPYQFPKGHTAKNRVVVPAMASQTADPGGFVTEKTLEHYRRLRRSQAGLIFVEYSFVHPSGRGEPHQLGVSSDEMIPGLKQISQLIHETGALAGLQIVHAGGKAESLITGEKILGASAIAVPVKGRDLETPLELPRAQISTYIQWFVEAARRARLAGFDFVELHAAHGYGLNQWLSPITNHRADDYGGSLENRQRLLIEIVRAIKEQVPGLCISTRIPGQDHFAGGLQISDMQSVAQALEAEGVDLINVSSGIGGWRRPEGRMGEGYLVGDAGQIKKAVSLPVIGVGGLKSADAIDQFLSEEKIDFAAVGRAILQDPEGWSRCYLSQTQHSFKKEEC